MLQALGSRFLILPTLLAASSCADPIDAPSAFTGERYLCGPEHREEFEAFLEECRTLRQTSVCGGVLSLRGHIDGEDVILDTRFGSVAFAVVPGDPAFSGDLALVAPAPYFTIKLNVMYLAAPPLASLSGLLPGNCTVLASDSSAACFLVNLEARGGNYLSSVVNVYRTMEIETATEKRISFTGDLAQGGYIDGCLHAFVPAPQ